MSEEQKRRIENLRVFTSFEDAERYDVEKDMAMTPEERVLLANYLSQQVYAFYYAKNPTDTRFQRVYRVVQQEWS
jgi:hypothetical protein